MPKPNRRYSFAVYLTATAHVDAPDAATAHKRLHDLAPRHVTLTSLNVEGDPEIIEVVPPDPDLKPATETTVTAIPA
ncbi:hypothetical protein SAMN05421505_120133 [Sinosporangium album]|uniref:Uncharacterized protein n=1 Tax=Sinosporangium album TaxID=504805 RepID=A0A1G8EJS5_9ACTN|nr:hypothetical protein [Sinosporangium album]SDH70193.1 hypothetical protein SAMN05421505_120133 [Sinosporangium album]